MPILYRQLSKELLALFFAILLILLTIILSFRLTNLLSAAATGDLPLRAVWQLLYLQSLRFLILLSPLSFILAATLTLGRLYRDHEISALLASGISQTHLLKALLLTALPLSFFLYLLNHHTLPHLYQQQDTLKQQANQQASLLLFTPNTFQQISDHLTLHASAQQQTQLQNILIAHTPPNQPQSLIFAQSGHIDPHTTPPQLHLNNGQRLNWRHLERPETISLDQFQHAQLTLPTPQITPSDRLRNLENHQLSQSPAHQSERQKRHNPALALLIFTLALPLLCQSKPRQSPYHKILPIFLLFSLYLNLLDTLTTLIKKTTLPAYPGSYSLHLLLLALTAYFWHRYHHPKSPRTA